MVATFAGTGPSYTAQHALVNPLTCKFVQWAPATYTLGDRTIDIAFADHWRFIMTRSSRRCDRAPDVTDVCGEVDRGRVELQPARDSMEPLIKDRRD